MGRDPKFGRGGPSNEKSLCLRLYTGTDFSTMHRSNWVASCFRRQMLGRGNQYLGNTALDHDGTAAKATVLGDVLVVKVLVCLLYTSPSPRDLSTSRMPSSA